MHRALLHSRAGGFAGVPALARTDEGDTLLSLDGRLFDAQRWLIGGPLSGRSVWDEPVPNVVRPLRPETLACLAAAVARFHRSTESLASENADEERSLSVRLAEVSGYAETHHERLVADARDLAKGEDRRVALRWLDLLPEAIALAEAILRDHPAGARDASTLCHGDLWAPHVHFARTNFVGFADFESVFFGSAASDLAQLVLHFDAWAAHDAVTDAYEEVLPLGREDRAVLPAAAVADLTWEGYWSLGLLYGGSRRLRSAQKRAHETNLRALLGSLELVVAETEETGVKRPCVARRRNA